MSREMRTIMHVAGFSSFYAGNFIASLICLGQKTPAALGMPLVLVLPKAAQGRAWLDMFSKNDVTFLFIDLNQPFWKRYQALSKMARQHNAVVIHSHFTTFDIDAVVAARTVHAKVIWHVHSDSFGKYTMKQRLKDIVKMRIIATRYVDSAMAVSPSVGKTMRFRGFPDSKITIVPNGIEVSRIQLKTSQLREETREKYGISGEMVIFLLFGHAQKRKGVDLLIQAATTLESTESGKNILFLIVSESTVDCLPRSIRIIPPVENVSELYSMTDCFVSASRSEGFPYAIAEAMAAGLPIISSNLPVVEQVYPFKDEGLMFFPSGDSAGLTKCITRFTQTPVNRMEKLGLRNSAFVRENLTVEKWRDNVIREYEKILR